MSMPAKTSKNHPSTCAEELFHHLAEFGLKGRIVSVQHLPELKGSIEGFHGQGLFDKDFYLERLAWFDFRVPTSLPEARSLIVVAAPRPQSQVVFTWNGENERSFFPQLT